MKTKSPFNIYISDLSKNGLSKYPVISATEIDDVVTKDFHNAGLYSPLIFGKPGDKDRDIRRARILLNQNLIHPKVFNVLASLKSLYKGIAASTEYAIWDDTLKDFVRSDVIDGETGYAFFISHVKDIVHVRNKSRRRDAYIDFVEMYVDKMIIQTFPILPAGLRDIEKDSSGRPVEPEINGLYRAIMTKANSIRTGLRYKEDDELDLVRWNMQRDILAAHALLEDMVSGKRGIIQSKWAARRIVGGTANVISTLVPVADSLDSPALTKITETGTGIYQYLKGTVPLVFHKTKEICVSKFITDDGAIYGINRKTLKREKLQDRQKDIDSWTIKDDFEKLINRFGDSARRHRPIMLGDHYLCMVYKTSDTIKLVFDPDELPSDKKRSNLSPITWAELFYIVAEDTVGKTGGTVTRYPITGIGSTYPTLLKILSTEEFIKVNLLNDDWTESDKVYQRFPLTEKLPEFVDTLILHPSMLDPLGGDYDGDRCSLNIVYSDEGVADIHRVLDSEDFLLRPGGGTWLSVGNMLGDWVLSNFY